MVNFIALFQESAPWLLLGLLVAGVMKWLVPMELLKRHMGKSNVLSVIKAAFIGAPLPLCSCGVIPAAIGLRRAGASKPATVSFLVATPETGVDSISVSYALLGPFMAIIRPFSAIFSAIYVGLLTLLLVKNNQQEAINEPLSDTQEADKTTSCCSKTKVAEVNKVSTCCSEEPVETTEVSSFSKISRKVVNVLEFSSGKLLEDITFWLLLGLIIAAAVKTWVATDLLTQWGDGMIAMVVMALVGIPMYICATASTPIAAGFLAIGVSPGAVLVFMLAGPATNLSTMGMIRKEMGTKVLVAYLSGIITASISLGYLTNWLVSEFSFTIYQVAEPHHHMDSSLLYPVSGLILGLLMLRNLVKKYAYQRVK